jgi:hypothetical protein
MGSIKMGTDIKETGTDVQKMEIDAREMEMQMGMYTKKKGTDIKTA